MESDPVVLFERAANNAVAVAATVDPSQFAGPTPCRDWTVAQLLEHMAAGTSYLLGALGVAHDPPGGDVDAYAAAVTRCVAALRQPGALEARCQSPAGVEWSITEATAGTFMDRLVHTLLGAMGRQP